MGTWMSEKAVSAPNVPSCEGSTSHAMLPCLYTLHSSHQSGVGASSKNQRRTRGSASERPAARSAACATSGIATKKSGVSIGLRTRRESSRSAAERPSGRSHSAPVWAEQSVRNVSSCQLKGTPVEISRPVCTMKTPIPPMHPRMMYGGISAMTAPSRMWPSARNEPPTSSVESEYAASTVGSASSSRPCAASWARTSVAICVMNGMFSHIIRPVPTSNFDESAKTACASADERRNIWMPRARGTGKRSHEAGKKARPKGTHSISSSTLMIASAHARCMKRTTPSSGRRDGAAPSSGSRPAAISSRWPAGVPYDRLCQLGESSPSTSSDAVHVLPGLNAWRTIDLRAAPPDAGEPSSSESGERSRSSAPTCKLIRRNSRAGVAFVVCSVDAARLGGAGLGAPPAIASASRIVRVRREFV